MAKLTRDYSTARIIELLVEDMLATKLPYADDKKEVVVRTFHDGTNSGLSFSYFKQNSRSEIKDGGFQVVFVTIDRNSDEERVVLAFSNDYSYELLSRTNWESREFFEWDKYNKAAERVCELLFGRGEKYGWKKPSDIALTST